MKPSPSLSPINHRPGKHLRRWVHSKMKRLIRSIPEKGHGSAAILLLMQVWLPIALLHAQSLVNERPFEPVIIQGGSLDGHLGCPVDRLHLFAYRASADSWEPMPFQIDERTYGEDPLNPPVQRWFYFIPDEWEISAHDSLLSDHDELVFMVRDLGDRAPANRWIDNEESRAYDRIEVEVFNPIDPESKGFAYLFQSSSFNEARADPYRFYFDGLKDSLSTACYSIDIGPYGLIEDICIHPPHGSGIDFFDTQKLRFSGILDFFIPVDLRLNETHLYVYDTLEYTSDPVVRLIRRARQTIRIGTYIAHQTAFYITTHFFPYSGRIASGASIASEDLKIQYPGSDVSIVLRAMRQSWDFNAHAEGMHLTNRYNTDVTIDGTVDDVQPAVDLPLREWSLVTGQHGSVLFYMQLEETDWESIEMYYHDSRGGGQADSEYFGSNDTGDDRSYGDHGLFFFSNGRDSLDLNMNFRAVFIPETTLTAQQRTELVESVLHPVTVRTGRVSSVEPDQSAHIPDHIFLAPGFPNPFNDRTSFRIQIPRTDRIRLEICDSLGRRVKRLIDAVLGPGRHAFIWDGTNDHGSDVPSGLYFVRLVASSGVQVRKAIITR